MPIPQSQINDIPTLTNLAASADSSWEAIDLLQILDGALNVKTYKKYYDSAGEFSLADSSNVGMIINENNPSYLENTFKSYFSTGSKWKLFREEIISNNIPGYQGDVGYQIGSNAPASGPAPFATTNFTIWSWPTNADVPSVKTPHGVMSSGVTHTSAAKGATHGYILGGYFPGQIYPSTPNPNFPGTVPYAENNIQSFPFAATTGSTDVAQLSVVSILSTSNSDVQSGYAYSVGGNNSSVGFGAPPYTPFLNNVVDAFPTISVVPAVDIGNLATRVYHAAGMSSPTDGYSASGGGSPVVFPQVGITGIQKFPFSGLSPVTVSNVATMSPNRYHFQSSGTNSTTDAYIMGGYGSNPGNFRDGGDQVTKFPFASETTLSSLTNLTFERRAAFGVSGPTHGYIVGGTTLPPSPTVGSSGAEKVTFANDTISSANSVGSPAAYSRFNSGTQSD